MDKLKKFIDVYVPVEACTLRCEYCYITHHRLFASKLPKFQYNADAFRQALSKKRLGGTCLFNFCGGGETLLAPEMTQYIKALLEEGHYVMVVTNATVSRAFDEMSCWDKDLIDRLFFKFSYHYMELRKRNLLDKFWGNIRKMKEAGASFTLELTPYDDLIPHIDDIKQRAMEEVGAWPHVTVARNERIMDEKPILTTFSKDEYYKKWSVFDSELFEFKFSIFGEKRKEFCYAGDWMGYLNMGNWMLQQCNSCISQQNIFDDVEKPLYWRPIGNFCREPHCFNGHAWIGLGGIPGMSSPTYAEMRNRKCIDGTEWLQPKMKDFLSQRLYDNNVQLTSYGKLKVNLLHFCYLLKRKIKRKIIRIFSKV